MAKIRVIKGEIRNTILLEKVGNVISFENSFTASARGWGIPHSLTLLGPLRNWE